ncbi:MAG: hypothetical protein ACE37K_20235 [Planctomycetota bacterium]
MPLSRFTLDLLRNRKATNPPDQGWAFPAFTKRGTSHAVTVQKYVYAEIDGKKAQGVASDPEEPAPAARDVRHVRAKRPGRPRSR